jgi:hypothetical protein
MPEKHAGAAGQLGLVIFSPAAATALGVALHLTAGISAGTLLVLVLPVTAVGLLQAAGRLAEALYRARSVAGIRRAALRREIGVPDAVALIQADLFRTLPPQVAGQPAVQQAIPPAARRGQSARAAHGVTEAAAQAVQPARAADRGGLPAHARRGRATAA